MADQFLIYFCASHITCENRYGLLKSMIESVKLQIHQIPIYISTSSTPECEHLIKQLCMQYKHSQTIKIFSHETQLSQFEHYAFLCSQIPNIFLNNTWCLFCDDDDYNHPSRSMHYRNLLLSTTYLKKCHSALFQSTLMVHESPTTQNHTLSQLKNCTKTRTVPGAEYVLHCTRLFTLNKFCNFMMRHGKLKSMMCDLVMGSLLFNLDFTWGKSDHWLYAYSCRSTSDRVSSNHGLVYYKKTYSKELFLDLEKEFDFKWKGTPGFSYVFGNDDKKNNKKPPGSILKRILCIGLIGMAIQKLKSI